VVIFLKRIRITKIAMETDMLPMQYMGLTADNRQVYIRHRYGHFTVHISNEGYRFKKWRSMEDNYFENAAQVFSRRGLGGEWGSGMGYEGMRWLLKKKFILPKRARETNQTETLGDKSYDRADYDRAEKRIQGKIMTTLKEKLVTEFIYFRMAYNQYLSFIVSLATGLVVLHTFTFFNQIPSAAFYLLVILGLALATVLYKAMGLLKIEQNMYLKLDDTHEKLDEILKKLEERM
jgi:hypothetical protein